MRCDYLKKAIGCTDNAMTDEVEVYKPVRKNHASIWVDVFTDNRRRGKPAAYGSLRDTRHLRYCVCHSPLGRKSGLVYRL